MVNETLSIPLHSPLADKVRNTFSRLRLSALGEFEAKNLERVSVKSESRQRMGKRNPSIYSEWDGSAGPVGNHPVEFSEVCIVDEATLNDRENAETLSGCIRDVISRH